MVQNQTLLMLASLTMEPYSILGRDSNGNVVLTGGCFKDLFQILSEHLQFSYQLVTPKEGAFGVKKNGSWTGMLGMVFNKEVDAIFPIFPKAERTEVIDFSDPVVYEVMSFLVASPKLLSKNFQIFNAFTIVTWASILTTYLASVGTLFLMSQFTRKCGFEKLKLERIFFFFYSILVFNGTRFNLPKVSSLQLVTGCWILFGFVVMASFQGCLISFMSKPSMETPIDDARQLALLVNNQRYLAGSVKGSFMQDDLEKSKDGVFYSIGGAARLNPDKTKVDSFEDGVHRVLKGGYAFIAATYCVLPFVTEMGEEKFHFPKEHLFTGFNTIGLQKQSPLRKPFNKALRRMQEAGMIDKWNQNSLLERQAKRRVSDEKESAEEEESSFSSLSLDASQAAFLILCIGYLASIVAFLCERLNITHKPTKQGFEK